MRKAILTVLLVGVLVLTACSGAKQVYVSSDSQSASSAAEAESSSVPQMGKVHLETAKLTEEDNRFLSLTTDGTVLLYDYTAEDTETSVELTCYELAGTQLEVVNRIAIPAEKSGRIAVAYYHMVEGFRLAVETSNGVKNMKLENPDRKLSDGAASVGAYVSVDENDDYGKEIPLASEIVSSKDSVQTISAQELWEHPEKYMDSGYEGVYLLTLSITQKQT